MDKEAVLASFGIEQGSDILLNWCVLPVERAWTFTQVLESLVQASFNICQAVLRKSQPLVCQEGHHVVKETPVTAIFSSGSQLFGASQ